MLEVLAYRLLRLFVRMMSRIPLPLAQFTGKMVGTLAFLVPMARKADALDNLLQSFGPEMSEEGAKRLLRKVYIHFGQMFLEVPHAMRLNPKNLHRYVVFESEEHFHNALKKGKGVLALTGHLGNWEMVSAVSAVRFGNTAVVARSMDFKPLERLVIDVRSRYGTEIIPKQRSMRKVLMTLRENKIIGILLDQNVDWYEGAFVNFFGRPACTNKGLALVALKTGAPVVPIFSAKAEDGRYRIMIGKEVDLIRTGDKLKDVEENTALFTSIIERSVREHPEQYFWFHKRWKTRNYCPLPPGYS
jgi:Kdo2-lipid IVA lauroyltransferase/acyltransferase